jgi:hypothetical protein
MSKSKTPQFPEVITHTDQLLREHHLLLLAPTDSSRHPILIDWETDKPASKSRVRKYVQGWMDDPGFPDHEVIERIAADAGCPVRVVSNDSLCVEFAT